MLEIKMEGCRRTFPGLSFNVFVGGCGGGVCVCMAWARLDAFCIRICNVCRASVRRIWSTH